VQYILAAIYIIQVVVVRLIVIVCALWMMIDIGAFSRTWELPKLPDKESISDEENVGGKEIEARSDA
jgi:hypothetical protein